MQLMRRRRSARDVAGYDAVIDDYEQLDALGIAAEAAAELADVHRAAADTRQAVAAQQRSDELAARAGGLGTPVWLAVPASNR